MDQQEVMMPKIHDQVNPNINVYTYLNGTVMAFYYAHYVMDGPSDCRCMFVVGEIDD
jgi:hypothetical protein